MMHYIQPGLLYSLWLLGLLGSLYLAITVLKIKLETMKKGGNWPRFCVKIYALVSGEKVTKHLVNMGLVLAGIVVGYMLGYSSRPVSDMQASAPFYVIVADK